MFIEYLKAYQTVTYPDSSGWWTDEWEIVITDFMYFRSPKVVEIDGTRQVIDYVIIGGANKHYTAWNRIKIKDRNGVTGEYTLNATKGAARYIEPRSGLLCHGNNRLPLLACSSCTSLQTMQSNTPPLSRLQRV